MQKEKERLREKIKKIDLPFVENRLLPSFFGLTPQCDSEITTCVEANMGEYGGDQDWRQYFKIETNKFKP